MTTKFYERLSNDLTQLLENPIDYNVTIEVGEEPDNQIYKVHSYILQSRNSYFQKKLNEISFDENHIKVIKMSNISVKIFNIIINILLRKMTTKFYERLSNDLTQLLENPIDYNVTIEVGEEPDNQIYKVHSYILQSRNSYFQKKLNEISFDENHIKVIKMSNISVKIFNIIIKYIYGGIISLEKLENSVIFDLLITSIELNFDELVNHLQTHFVNNNASWLRLNFSRVYRASWKVKNFNIIQDFCNNIISKYPNTIFESENFLTLPEDALITIIKNDDLQLKESKIWQYVIQWGKAQNQTLPSNLDEWTSDNFLTLKTTLKQCLSYIRYFSISSKDVFEMISPYQQILEPELWLDINSKIVAPNKPISSIVLLPRKILNVTLPTRTTLSSSWREPKIFYTESDDSDKDYDSEEDIEVDDDSEEDNEEDDSSEEGSEEDDDNEDVDSEEDDDKEVDSEDYDDSEEVDSEDYDDSEKVDSEDYDDSDQERVYRRETENLYIESSSDDSDNNDDSEEDSENGDDNEEESENDDDNDNEEDSENDDYSEEDYEG
ncbi:hypothetical protein Glove_74g218 [Diversispora epigaea]|uniref:BTB domain-containing protein n=1 Tax=Diversispora epigaea TaxID=1348612 RepID=A0A397J950_9GLOM|nr:hypothetical protein Glove_74g218 [Diversispora epigaea]